MLEQNYIIGARVRGLPYRRILIRHALRNASGPALTILGNDFPLMLAGAVAAEVGVLAARARPAAARTARETRDIPVVQGVLLVVAHVRRGRQPRGEHAANVALPVERRDRRMSSREQTPIAGRGSVLRLPSARIAVVILAVVIFLTIFGSTLAPQNPLTINANALFQGPSLHHLLGTDYLGRDVLSRLMAGTRLSVLTAFEAVGIGLVLGAPLGVATVFLGKWFDFAANRVADALMTLPYIFFAVAVTAALGNGLVQAMFAVGILLCPGLLPRHQGGHPGVRARPVRGGGRAARRVEAACHPRARGAQGTADDRGDHGDRRPRPRCCRSRSSPSSASAWSPPAPTWGGVLSSDLDYLYQAPWAPFIPGALIAITVGALNALADAFRDRTGPGTLPGGRPGHQDPFHPRGLWRPPMTGNPPPDEVLGIEDLHITVHDGAATAVRGISLSVAHGRDRRPGRGVGQRQDADLPGRPRRAAAGLRRRAGDDLVRAART